MCNVSAKTFRLMFFFSRVSVLVRAVKIGPGVTLSNSLAKVTLTLKNFGN